jgi:hypothetical protein
VRCDRVAMLAFGTECQLISPEKGGWKGSAMVRVPCLVRGAMWGYEGSCDARGKGGSCFYSRLVLKPSFVSMSVCVDVNVDNTLTAALRSTMVAVVMLG